MPVFLASGTCARLVITTLSATGILLAILGITASVDLKVLDAQFAFLRHRYPVTSAREVVVVGIDETTLKEFPEPMALWHGYVGQFIDAMMIAEPAAVGLDLVLPDRSYDAVRQGTDRELLVPLIKARRSFPVILGLSVDEAGRPRPVHLPFLAATGESRAGFVVFAADPDGVVRRFEERLGLDGGPVPTLAGQMARHLGATPRSGWIDFARGRGLRHIALQEVLAWHHAGERALLERTFRGRPVLLGVVLPHVDRHRVPVDLAASAGEARDDSPGLFLQAQVLENLLDRGMVQSVPTATVAVLAAVGGLFWLIPAGWLIAALAFGSLAVLALAASTWLLSQGAMLPVMPFLVISLLALAGRNALETFRKLNERRKLRASFSRYVSPPVLQEILAGRLRPEPGGEHRFVCVLFADLRGHTRRSEHMAPIEVIRFLNRYFEQVVRVIHHHGGTVVSFMGDGIMAVFGAPQALAEPCEAAFQAAGEMLHLVRQLGDELEKEGSSRVDVGIGLNAGEAVCGHIGAAARHEYTATGDVTNVASRLEAMTKKLGYRMLLTNAVRERLQNAAGLEPLGMSEIPGHASLELYGYERY